eukprot:1156549-Pelagomonas_calceolata.AAC.5
MVCLCHPLVLVDVNTVHAAGPNIWRACSRFLPGFSFPVFLSCKGACAQWRLIEAVQRSGPSTAPVAGTSPFCLASCPARFSAQ